MIHLSYYLTAEDVDREICCHYQEEESLVRLQIRCREREKSWSVICKISKGTFKTMAFLVDFLKLLKNVLPRAQRERKHQMRFFQWTVLDHGLQSATWSPII